MFLDNATDIFSKVNSADYCEEQRTTHSICKCASTEACNSQEYCFNGSCTGNDQISLSVELVIL